MARLNITLPDAIAKKLAVKQNKSRFIAEALSEKLEREKKEQIKQLLREGYATTKKEDSELNNDWEATGLERWE